MPKKNTEKTFVYKYQDITYNLKLLIVPKGPLNSDLNQKYIMLAKTLNDSLWELIFLSYDDHEVEYALVNTFENIYVNDSNEIVKTDSDEEKKNKMTQMIDKFMIANKYVLKDKGYSIYDTVDCKCMIYFYYKLRAEIRCIAQYKKCIKVLNL